MQPNLSLQSKDFVFEERKTTNPERKTAERRNAFVLAGKRGSQGEIKNPPIAAEFADECRPIAAPPSPSSVCLRIKHQHVALQSKYRNEFIPQSSQSSAPIGRDGASRDSRQLRPSPYLITEKSKHRWSGCLGVFYTSSLGPADVRVLTVWLHAT